MSDVVTTTPMLTNNDDVLRALKSFDDVAALMGDAGIKVIDYSEEFGNGFTLIKDKNSLVGVEFIIVEQKQVDGDYGDGKFTVVHCMTINGDKVIFVDGGSGIHAQCMAMTERGIVSGVHVRGGLTRSDYEYENDKGKMEPATTYYLAQ